MAKGKKKARVTLSDMKQEELEGIVANLANQGMTPSEIGVALRDQHGVPSVKKLTGMNLEKILEKKGLQGDMPRDLLNLISRSVVLFRHMQANKKDMTAKRGYLLTVSKIRRLAKYYIREKRLAKDWRYTQEAAELLVK
ncbi:30S ribosomal protein S15 [uncultured archaeon]|nr:30S ribosomal protein S15 [uncultured archaeon]